MRLVNHSHGVDSECYLGFLDEERVSQGAMSQQIMQLQDSVGFISAYSTVTVRQPFAIIIAWRMCIIVDYTTLL